MAEFTNIDWKTQEQADEDNLQKILNAEPGQDEEHTTLFDPDRPLDAGEKADDAEDFEDISDDDLPEEEGPAGTAEADVPDLTDDMGTSHDTDDLFGDYRGSSPFEYDDHDEIQPNGLPHPTNVDGALPPPSAEPEINLRELNFPEHYDSANQDPLIPAPAESEEELLKQSWPTFERGVIIDWNALIVEKGSRYPLKTPEKPPKPVNPTKVSLEIAPDQEKSFRAPGPATSDKRKRVQEAEAKGLVAIVEDDTEEGESDDGLDWTIPDPSEMIGGITWTDLEIMCEDWDAKINTLAHIPVEEPVVEMDAWEQELYGDAPAPKRRKTKEAEKDFINAPRFSVPSFDDFEASTRNSAKRVSLDLNDPYLLVDTQEYSPTKRRRLGPRHKAGKSGVSSILGSRFNISNDEAYDALKENHQHKVRATLGNVSLEHSMPALRLQWPYYRTKLFVRDARTWHRATLKFNKFINLPITFSRPLMRKKKQVKNMPTHELFKETKDLSLADHYSSATLLEYSEEHPIVLSNFGMGNRIINYYRRKDANDGERPQPEDKVGDVTPLLPEDRSPFANFGEVSPGETVRTLHNSMYRAPIFKHETKNTDFLVVRSTTGVGGSHWYIRNIDHLFAVGQQFPSMEIPGPHSRRVTNAVKQRMKMIAYRKMRHHANGTLKIGEITAHINDTSDMQNRQKMKEFFVYDKTEKVWKMRPGEMIPDESAIRVLIKPEEVCCLNAMEVGTRHLNDAGYEVDDLKKDKDDVDDDDHPAEEGQLEKSLAPWKTSKAFLDASTGKAMLKLHGEGDPSGCGLAFSMIRTSMKGGYIGAVQGPQATSEAAIAAEKKANGGHTYNVKKQEELYQNAIRDIWDKQKQTLSDVAEHEENDMEREQAEEDERLGASQTPHSAPTPFDETASLASGFSTNARQGRVMRITRKVSNGVGGVTEITEIVKDMRVWREYQKRRHALDADKTNIYEASIKPTGNTEWDKEEALRARKELARLERNRERRFAREKQKGNLGKHSDSAGAGSPSTSSKPGGTNRKCANCGQTGHIKTNKKYCPGCDKNEEPFQFFWAN
ncbi:putative transcription initiation factor TFIID kDa subunit [Amylocarpus encephaloides]|uniref:Transcription initiation factor TFIID kDa subunit n=1 Tax=Amylocarpus encephaloides TaxID=45428 RepID=A0A9P7YKW1_9HELO|nr:putative transcription initiation factor TFIID kDa subunit [Amylocarpus encephaloides]